jgi:uncharacterized protein (TIGR02284 family)
MAILTKTLNKTALINDLIKINDGRIICYEQVLNNCNSIEDDLKELLVRIVENSKTHRNELADRLMKLQGRDKITIAGIIYRAWIDLKVSLVSSTRSSIINFCLYNEEMALQTYKAALNLAEKIDDDLRTIILHQQDALTNIYELIKNRKEARHTLDSRLVYFN